MLTISPEEFETLPPLACAWAEEQESLILEQRVALTEARIADARGIGVAAPERVRLLQVEKIPLTEHPGLHVVGEAMRLLSPETAGLTLYYGILIRTPLWGARDLAIRELVHVCQYEQFGGFAQFLRQCLLGCVTQWIIARPRWSARPRR
jgi:hypothetical protein